MFWYDLKNDGLSREYNEHNFGLIHHQDLNCAPKPGIVAMSVFVRQTAGAEFRELVSRDGLCAARYRRADGTDLLLLWTERGERNVTLSGHVESVHNLMGSSQPAAAQSEIGENVIYVRGHNLSIAQ